MKVRVDCWCIWPIIRQGFLIGGPLSWRGGVFEVIQSLSDSLCRRVWGRVVGVRSRRAVVHLQTLFGKETPLKIAPQFEETTPGDDFLEITQRNDCATRTTNKRNQAIKC